MLTGILISGGIDSIALTHWIRPDVGITIDYGQKSARTETGAAAEVCAALGIEHVAVAVDFSSLGSGDLVGTAPLAIAPVSEWWPYRNQLLVTVAAAALVPRGVSRLAIGCVATDGIHVDGTAAFIAALSTVLNLQEGHLSLDAPAIHLTSVQLVQQSGVPIEILSWAHSCHVADYACGRCRGCIKHYTTFRDLGLRPY